MDSRFFEGMFFQMLTASVDALKIHIAKKRYEENSPIPFLFSCDQGLRGVLLAPVSTVGIHHTEVCHPSLLG